MIDRTTYFQCDIGSTRRLDYIRRMAIRPKPRQNVRALSCKYRKEDSKYHTHTLRGRCPVHRVYHCITLGLALYSSFISGQIRLALSLRGPGYVHEFKELFFDYLLHNHLCISEEIRQGPGTPFWRDCVGNTSDKTCSSSGLCADSRTKT